MSLKSSNTALPNGYAPIITSRLINIIANIFILRNTVINNPTENRITNIPVSQYFISQYFVRETSVMIL